MRWMIARSVAMGGRLEGSYLLHPRCTVDYCSTECICLGPAPRQYLLDGDGAVALRYDIPKPN